MSRKIHKIVTRESMATMLAKDNSLYVQTVIGRALVAIFNRQTRSEKAVNDVREHNTVGFSGADAKGGSITAKYWLKHRKLEPWMVKKWTENSRGFPRICKYHKQLNEIAMEK
jgi:hypothetical protein